MTRQAGRLVFINGSSSAGKTTASRQLQLMLGMDCLYLSMDKFLGMLSEQACSLDQKCVNFLQPHAGLYAVQKDNGSFDIAAGPLGRKLLHEMYDVVQYFLDQGWQVIFDTVETEAVAVLAVQQKFSSYRAHYIYLYAHPATLQQREWQRGNRLVGQTLNILNRFDSQDLHTLQIDTTNLTPQAIVEQIFLEVARN